MSKNDPTPPRNLHTPQNPPPQPAPEDSTSKEDKDAPDIWSDELFPLNILPFSDSDPNSDPDYTASKNSSPSVSDDTEGEDHEVTEDDDSEHDTEEEDNEDEEDPENNEEEDNEAEEADDEEEDNKEEEASGQSGA